MTTPNAPVARTRVLGAFAIACVTFAQVAGSPVGIEDAVHAGGAFGCLLVLVVMACVWAIPQSLITAELATALPVSGGVIVWVEDALGPALGFANTWLVLLFSVFDLSTYSLLFAEIIADLWPPAAETAPKALLGLSISLLSFTINIFGAQAVAACSEWLTALILLPFLVFPLVIAAEHAPLDGKALGPAGVPRPILPSPLVSSVQWNMMGWGTVGALAAEARAGSFPLGVLGGVALVSAAYSWPVLWGYAAVPDPDSWSDGSFPRIASSIAPWFGTWMACAASLSAISGAVGTLASYSRQLQAAAGTGALPLQLLTQDWWRWKTPVPAMAVLTLISAPMVLLDLGEVIIIDTGFNSIVVALLAIAFLRLRWTRPELERSFKVPWGWAGALISTGSIVGFVVFSLYASSIGAPVYTLPVIVSITAALLVAGAVKERCWPAANASKPRPQAGSGAASLRVPSPFPQLARRGPSNDEEGLPLLISETWTQPAASEQPQRTFTGSGSPHNSRGALLLLPPVLQLDNKDSRSVALP